MTGTANRDADRMRRARRLRFAYMRGGDRRKLKRATRLEQMVFRSTMRRMAQQLRMTQTTFKQFSEGVRKVGEAIQRFDMSSRLAVAMKATSVVAPSRDAR